jgi:hypothetical protein
MRLSWLAACAAVCAAVSGLCVTPPRAAAQLPAVPRYAEYRADVIVGRGTAVQAGAGEVIPLDTYVRLGIDAAVGPAWRDGGMHASGRVDAIGRFLLDPFREIPVAVSLGGGVSVPYTSGDAHLRPYATVVLDVEGRKRGGWTPAVQLGLGGGARLGVVLRRSAPRYR